MHKDDAVCFIRYKIIAALCVDIMSTTAAFLDLTLVRWFKTVVYTVNIQVVLMFKFVSVIWIWVTFLD